MSAETVSWSNDEWHAEHIDAGFVRLSRCRDGPSPLQARGDSCIVARALLD